MNRNSKWATLDGGRSLFENKIREFYLIICIDLSVCYNFTFPVGTKIDETEIFRPMTKNPKKKALNYRTEVQPEIGGGAGATQWGELWGPHQAGSQSCGRCRASRDHAALWTVRAADTLD